MKRVLFPVFFALVVCASAQESELDVCWDSVAGTLKLGACAEDSEPEPDPDPVPDPVCGDGVLNQPWEQCEADGELDGKTCADFEGFTDGTLRCTAPAGNDPGCQFETSLCTDDPGPQPDPDPEPDPSSAVCDGQELEAEETCDGLLLGGSTCSSVLGTGWVGELACAPDCRSFDTSGCVQEQPPPPPDDDTYSALAARLPEPGQLVELADLSPESVLTEDGEFPFCDQIGCFKSENAFNAWVGMAFDQATGRWWNPAGGGHADYGGNEIYRFDFPSLSWTRVTEPQPLTGPFVTDTDDDGVPDACPLPADGPGSAHTYDGAIYVPATNEVLVVGTVPFCSGAMGQAVRGWAWSPATARWRQLPDGTPMPRYSRTAYDPGREVVYLAPSGGPLYTLDPKNNYAVTDSQSFGNMASTGTMFFEPAGRNLYVFSRFRITEIHVELDGTFGPSRIVWDWTEAIARGEVAAQYIHSNGDKLNNGVLSAAAWHDPTGTILLWDGANGLFWLDPEAGSLEDLSVAMDFGLSSTNTIYSKWVYVSDVDAFVGLHRGKRGLFVYRPDFGASPPPPPPPPASDFDSLANAPGVVMADPLDTQARWWVDESGTKHEWLNADGTSGIPTHSWWRNLVGVSNKGPVLPQLDASTKSSGTGSLRFEFRDLSKSGHGGVFAVNFSQDLSRTFGEGETFYVRYRMRYSCEALYFDCDPTSPTYKTTRRFFRTPGGGKTAMKSLILAEGDPEPGVSSDACTWMQIVLNHGPDHYLSGYHSCGWYAGWDERTGEGFWGSGQLDWQAVGERDENGDKILGLDDTVSPTCWWMPDPLNSSEKRSWGTIGPDCWQLEADEWMTIIVGLSVGTWQPEAQGVPNSHVDVWAAHEGEPLTRIIDHDLYLRGPRFDPEGKYGKVWFLPFMTNKDETEQHPTFYVWYDELIVYDSLPPELIQ